ncbi:MAG: dihydrofolate reductase [Lachnospiraceae bacterium]|nr:dihydrofolate reductase [Lachnospiraceae bacterium]MBQ6544456.1 dihydrofolate reductase [Lachnospiraceae bacterium]
MNAIVCADENWAIGNEGKQPVSIPADRKFFRMKTEGKCVVLGRKTLAAFPGGRPLKNRRNIILTRNPDFQAEGAECAHSVEEALELVKNEDPDDVYIIGGDQIYRAFLPYVDRAYVTRVDFAYAADTYFPDLDSDPEWEVTEEGEEQTYFDVIYRFMTYERRK